MIYDEIKKLEKKKIFLEDKIYVGILLFIRKIRGRKTGKKEKEAYDSFIEFILPNL